LSGQKKCRECPKGVLCKNGIKTVCEPGQTTVGSNSDKCVPCDAGFFRETIPTISNQAGFCFSADEPKRSDQNKCPPGYICPLNASKTATQKIICEKNHFCVNNTQTKCGQDTDSFGYKFDLVSNPGASKCTRPNGYLCPTNSGDCVSGCCGKTWFADTNKCLNKADAAYGCL
jgi:hypothetical protein